MKIKRIGDPATTDGTAERESRLYADRMEALVQAQRILANSQASIDELVDRIPELALNVVAASGAMFELLDGEVTIIRAASAAVTSLAVLGTRWPLAPSLGGEAIRLGTTVRCDDAEDDPRVAKTICRKLGARSIVVVVVRDKAGPIGLLKLFDSQPSRFGASTAHSLELLAEALGAVLQRKRAEADSERMLRVQSGIVALQQEMASASTDLHASMVLVAERAQTLTGADGAAIALVDGHDIVNHVGTGVASGRVGWRLKRGGSLGGLSLERGEVLCCQDSEVDVRVSREDFRGFGLRSAIVAPLRVGGELAGALRVVCARANVFAEIDVSTVQILAQWLGTVMQRAADADRLRTSEAQYRMLFAAHPVPIWVYDLESLRFLAVNDSALAQYGYSREEFLCMTLRDVRTPVANQLLDAELTKLRNDPRAIGIGQHRRKDGTNVDVEVYPSTITFGRHAARVALIQDVTERRKAELSIRKSEWLLKIAGRAARVGGWSMDHETKSFSWSDQLSEIHDLPPGTACTTEEALRFYTPESRLTIRDAVLALGRSGTSFDLELELTTAVGRRIWVRSMGEAVRDAAGTIIGTQGAVQDISERKLAEQATRTLATRLTTMLDSIADAFYTLDRDWRFTYINADAERMIERSRADLLGRVIWEAIPGLVGTEFHRQYHDAVRARVAITAESYYEPWQQWLEVHAYPSDDGLTVHFRDVSERREAQAALKLLNQGLEVKVLQRTRELELANVALVSKEQEMRAVVEHMADGVVTFADDGTLRSANPKVEAIFGHSPAALIGRHVSILIPALLDLGTGDDAAAVSGIEDSIAAVGGEAYGRRLTGDAISLDIAFGAYHIGGQRLWTAIVRDIGERVRTLTALKEARHDAEEASRAKSAFVATMSHEIRTPMNGVIGMIDVLHQTELAPDQTRMLAVARDSAHALLGVIEDILDFSKIEAGRVGARAACVLRQGPGTERGRARRGSGPRQECFAGYRRGCRARCGLGRPRTFASGAGQPAGQRHQVLDRTRRRPGSAPGSGQRTRCRPPEHTGAGRGQRRRHGRSQQSHGCSSSSPKAMRRRHAASVAPASAWRSLITSFS